MTQKDAVMTEDYSQTYYRQWFIFAALALLVAGLYWYEAHVYRPHAMVPPVANAQMRNSYYVLHMPEMQIHSDIKSSREQFSKWLDALDREGFHIYLLSDVVRQLNQNIPLPEKTVVLVFDPGFRRTVDTYRPILEDRHIPAVLLTNGKAIDYNDKRFISKHVVELLQQSGLWDTGFYTPDSAVALHTRNQETVLLGLRTPWKSDAGRYALNRGIPLDAFDRLNVNAKWTEEDLIHRLLVERPVQGSTLLSVQQIQGRNWGMGLDMGATHDTRFTLRAPPDKRSGSLYWLGTTGINDVHLRMEVKSLVGEMRLLLRSDATTGDDVAIVFSRGKVAVMQDRHAVPEALATVQCPDIQPYVPFTAVLAVMGRQLALAVNGHPLVALDTLSDPTSNKSMIRLVVQDSIKGVGEARSVRIICTPLGKNK